MSNYVPPRAIKTAELKDARKLFNELDRDNSGFIDSEELAQALRSLGQDPTEEEVEELIRSVDGESGDRDGKIELREFLKLYTQGIDQAGKTNDTDINDCFASLGGDPRAQESRVDTTHLSEVMRNMFDLEIDLNETFGIGGKSLSKEDFHRILEAKTEDTTRMARRRTAVAGDEIH